MTTLDAADHLKFGIFLAPFHPVGQNPTLALERDLQLIEHLDALGFDEAWIGEHHSAGFEIIASPGRSGWAPGCRPCPITTPSCWPTASSCSTT
jgi:alkanesulfonate monooxygenase SsuD/methylene tetrahydromethanopterin reductase-like flavin-dependent oxidoreductase (luciferase family)